MIMQDRELIQRIKDATDLVELVGQAVKLRRQGNAWTGLCPFHSEKTPSFSVIPDKGFYHCFGCNVHGDAFTWLMEREGLNFAEAKEQLAKAAGIELPAFNARQDFAKEELNARIRSALEIAQAYFQRSLNEGGPAQDYLRQRGFSDDFARDAGLGFAPGGWENVVNLLRQRNFSPELIEQTGLATRNDRGNLRDFMRNRVTIPIHDTRGRLAAFGGRAMGDDKPKYLNTRETQLFKKSETLFGFHRAKGNMRDGALLVEGYFDVLQLHQEGINQAVAPMGTALTEEQLKAVARFTKKIVLCFDGDAAGQRATERSLKLALPLGFDVRLLLLPANEDPDTWCLRLGANGFRDMIRRAPDWAGFVLDRAREGRDLRKVADRIDIFQTFVTFFVFLPRTPENWSLLQSVAAELSIPKHELNRALKTQAAAADMASQAFQAAGMRHWRLEPTASQAFQAADTASQAFQAADTASMFQASLKTQNPYYADTGETESQDIDELLRPLIILCRDADSRREILQLPAASWEYLKGAPILQDLLDCDGSDLLLSVSRLGALRKLEAAWANREDSGIDLERVKYNLEKAFVMREIKLVGMLLKSPEIVTDAESKKRLEERQAQLLQRKSMLNKSLKTSW